MTRESKSADQKARTRIRTSLDENLIVEAAAGTGKTSELVRRIVAVLENGKTTVDRIVAVTFTRKAAGELKLRLRQELDKRRFDNKDPGEKGRLEDAMVRLEEAHIGTIHSFCADILRERPVEANIQPGFEELDEKESPRLFQRVFDRWSQEVMDDPPPGLRRALGRAATWDSKRTPLEQVRSAAWRLVEWRDFPASWRRESMEREKEIDRIVDQVIEVATIASTCPDPRDALRVALHGTVDFKNRIGRTEAVRSRDYDDLEAILVRLSRDLTRNKRKGRGKFSEAHLRAEVLEKREELRGALEDFKTRADADLAALLRDELWTLVDRYDTAKLGAGKLDFVDLLISTRNMVRDNLAVRNFLQQRFTHIFVDEFQDTDPLQAEILLLLAADDPNTADWMRVAPVGGKLFLVGDPKQSIYRFRRADVALYRALCERLMAEGVSVIYLTRSFRAVGNIQRLVNVAFEEEMNGDPRTGQPSYVPLEEHSGPITGQPSVVALSVPQPYSYGWDAVTKKAVTKSLPSAVGAFVQWLLEESGWRVRDPLRENSEVPIDSRHVCVLFRRFMSWGEDITRSYVNAFETRNVPHLLWGARSFHQREEVETIRAALTAIEWPDDELSVFATLKGSLFAITDALMVRYRHEVGHLRPFPRPSGEIDPIFNPVNEALDTLADLHKKRNWQPFVETINELLEATRAHAGFALRPAGNQVLANVYRVGDLARAFEARGGTSFRGFVEQLTVEAQTEDAAESPVLEEGAEGVCIMTVHAAKGLEFPVVILADITANLAAATPDKHVDTEKGLCAMRILGCSPYELSDHQDREHLRDQAEGVRIAYVAATRARDLLVVPAVGDGPMDGWVGSLNRALYPRSGSERNSIPAPGCPEFGESSVIDRPGALMGHEESSLRPGLHHLGPDTREVVWWDPHHLRLDVGGNFGIRQEDILTEDEDRVESERSIQQYARWQERRSSLLDFGSRQKMEVFTATEAQRAPRGILPEIEVMHVEREQQRPAGTRFGSLVHLVLRDVSVDADRDSIGKLTAFHARGLDATPEEVNAAVTSVSRTLAHPLMERFRSAREAHREFPVTVRTEEGAILEGVIDMTFRENDTWHVVDFKTDADIKINLEEYRAQVGWYVWAMNRITSHPARGYLLSV